MLQNCPIVKAYLLALPSELCIFSDLLGQSVSGDVGHGVRGAHGRELEQGECGSPHICPIPNSTNRALRSIASIPKWGTKARLTSPGASRFPRTPCASSAMGLWMS